eukprot:3879780-Prymnesium_polylepis.1
MLACVTSVGVFSFLGGGAAFVVAASPRSTGIWSDMRPFLAVSFRPPAAVCCARDCCCLPLCVLRLRSLRRALVLAVGGSFRSRLVGFMLW